MRAEVKVGLIVGLVAIAGGGIWWFSRPGNERDELPFDRTAMEATSVDDAALAGDAIPVLPEHAEPALAPARRTTPVLPPPGEPEPAGEPSERTSGDIAARPAADRTELGEAEPTDTSRSPGEAVERVRPGDSPPPDVPAPRRRTSLTEPRPPERKTYTIQPGDRLIDIARDEYDDGQLWKAIKAVNPGMDENRLQIGQKIEIPSRDEALRLTQPDVARADEASAAAERRARPGTDAGKVGRATYVVGHGDSLIKIARNVLNDETRWEEIYELNRAQIESPNLIQPGMELRLPPLEKKPSPEEAARG